MEEIKTLEQLGYRLTPGLSAHNIQDDQSYRYTRGWAYYEYDSNGNSIENEEALKVPHHKRKSEVINIDKETKNVIKFSTWGTLDNTCSFKPAEIFAIAEFIKTI